MKAGGSRRKGNDFERWVAAETGEALGLPKGVVKRGLSQTRGGGAEVPDVVLPEGLPFHLECKHSKADTPRTAIRQAVRDLAAMQRADLIPVAVVREHGTRYPVVGMFAADAQAFIASWRLGLPLAVSAVVDRCDDHPLVMFAWKDWLVMLAAVWVARNQLPAIFPPDLLVHGTSVVTTPADARPSDPAKVEIEWHGAEHTVPGGPKAC